MATDLVYALTKLQKTVSVIEPSFGIVNLDILLNQIPEYTAEGLFVRDKSFREIMANGPGRTCILLVSSGVPRPADQSVDQRPTFLSEVIVLGYSSYDLYIQKSLKYRQPWSNGLQRILDVHFSLLPQQFVHCHANFADRSDAVPLTAAISLKEKS